MGAGATRGAGTGMPSAAELAGLSREEKLALLRRLAAEESARGDGGAAAREPGAADAPDGTGRYPASFAQRRLWFLDRLEPGGSHNTIFRALRLRGRPGPVDRQALAGALARIVARHGALRTRFEEADGEPVQVVERFADLPPVLARADLSGLPAAERERRLTALARAEAAAPFDLGRAPLARFTLVDLGAPGDGHSADDAALLLAVHHIVADGWSLGILLRELSVLYAALRGGRSPDGVDLPELATGYGAYARSQRERLGGDRLERQLGDWREQLGGAPTVLDLPTDRPRPALASYRGAIEPFELGADLVADVRALARSERATPFMVLLAAFAATLSRWTGRDDLLVGTPVAGRPRSDLEPLIGFFANTLVLRADLRGRPSFREVVRRVRAQALGAFGQQEMPFERLVEALEEGRDLSRNPLYQVMFALQNLPAARLSLDGLTVEPMPVERGLSKVDLTLDLVERDGTLLGYLEYTTDLFDRTTVRRVASAIRRAVAAGVAAPDRPVLEMPALGDAERHALTVEWQGAESPRGLLEPVDGTGAALPVHEAIARRAAAAPDETAVEADATAWSYADLDRAAARIAAELAGLGVGVEDRVGVLAPRSVETIAAFLGVLRAGAAYVPLDPEYPDERLGFMAADAGVRVVLFPRGPSEKSELAERAERIAPDGAGRVALAPLGEAPPAEDPEPRGPRGPIAPAPKGWRRRAAYVLYTSGTTGRPKGVVVPHGALANHAAAVADAYRLGARDRVLQFASMSFDIAGEEIYPSLARGATLVLRTPALSLEPRGLVRFIDRRGLTVVNLPTPLWHEWCRELELAGARRQALLPPAGLRLVIVGTEGAQPERLRAWLDALERAGRTAPRWINAYGPTEATVTSTLYATSPGTPRPADGALGRVPIGRPVDGLTAFVLDGRMEPAPVGSAGELCLGGAGIARGYLGRPAATAAAFVPDPFAARRAAPGGRLYRTGDLARVRPDGAIEFLGRTDDQVKIRGFRIEPGEVEAALAGHPEVREVAVLARQVGEDRRLIAYLAPRDGGEPPTSEALAQWLLERLPAYMVPAAFIWLTELPLTPAGKVDRDRLPEPAPGAVAGGRAPYVPPRTPAEEALAAIWSDVLEVERVGVHEDFFRLGGHSLLATRVISRVRDRLGVELPLRDLFDARTVAALAPRLDAQTAEAGAADRPGPVLPPIRRLERKHDPAAPGPVGADLIVEAPLSFAHQRLWFLDRLEPGRAIYNVPAALRLETGGALLDPVALRGALAVIVRRHESLRTTFAMASGPGERSDGAREPCQLVHREASVAFRHHDLTGLPPGAAAAEAARLGALEGGAPFDLEAGPLVRFRLLSLPGDGPAPEHRLLVTFHHAVADGWSIDVFLRELDVLYEGLRDARSDRTAREVESVLPELPVQPADHAAWQRETLRGETLEALLSFWRETLDGAPQVIELPTDRPRPPVPSYRGGRCYFRVGAEVAAGLATAAGEAGASRFMALLAVWQVLLARLCGTPEVLVGSPVAGRDRAELEGLIGLFVNTLVLRGRVAPATPFRDHLERVREACLDAFAHAALPFERLVEELEPERSLAHNPLFQVMFSFQSSALVAAAPDHRATGSGNGPAMRPVLLSNYNGTARVDLALDLWEDGDGLTGYLEYASDLFDRSTAERLAGRYRRLLAAAAAAPGRPVGSLPLLSVTERHQVVTEWNATERPIPAGATLHGLVRERIRATPDAEAVSGPVDPATGEPERLTYGELGRRVDRLARHLRRLGVGPETLVGLFVERSVRMVVGMLGVLEAGGAYVPLDPSFPEERLAAMVEDAHLAVVLTEETLVGRLPASASAGSGGESDVRVLRLDGDWPEVETSGDGEGSVGSPLPEQLAYVIFTSGSTGRPKGVQISHRAAVSFLRSMAVAPGLGPDDTLLAVTTLSFDIALLELLLPLTVSARLAIASSAETRAGDELARRIAEVAPTVVQATPATWRMLLDLSGSEPGSRPGSRPGAEGSVLPPPAKVLCGGEALPRELAERLLDRGLELWNLYGPTETTVWSAALRMESGDGPVPVGGPIDNTSLYVLDPLCPDTEPAPIGVAGELAIGGAGLARGYLGRPAMTAERFRPDPFAGLHSSGGARMYRTGDLVRRRPDGRIHFLGRLDHQVKVRGYRIELGEIEAALRRHPAVRQAVAVVRDDRQGGAGGPGGPRLVAYAVVETEAETTVPDLRAALERRLPGYMVPSAFVLLEELPLTPNGKVDRRALPAPGADRAGLADGFVAPRTAVEEDLAGVWREVLGLERVGIQDNFFALGGHSLLATQVMTRVEEAFGKEAPVRLLFEAPTIEALAERLVDSGLGDMDQEALARALDEIESLTEDELEALLASGRPADRAG